MFAEGPVEINPSPVYWSARSFGAIKRILRSKHIAGDSPTHLFRTGGKQQLKFLLNTTCGLDLKYWQVYETGWPYANGGTIKKPIARLASLLGGKNIFGSTFGNRFRAILSLQ